MEKQRVEIRPPWVKDFVKKMLLCIDLMSYHTYSISPYEAPAEVERVFISYIVLWETMFERLRKEDPEGDVYALLPPSGIAVSTTAIFGDFIRRIYEITTEELIDQFHHFFCPRMERDHDSRPFIEAAADAIRWEVPIEDILA